MDGHRLTSPTIRTGLVLAFGLTVGLWALAGYRFTQRMATVQRQSDAVNLRYMRAQDLLSGIRTKVLLASLTVRDALLDPDPSATPLYQRQVAQIYGEVEDGLREYVPVLDARSEEPRVARLREQIAGFRSVVEGVLAKDTRLGSLDARAEINRRVVPQRTEVLRVSEEVQALNRAAYVRQQAATAAIYSDMQRETWEQLGLALVASLGIALFSTVRAGRLEKGLRVQQTREAAHTRDLQALSSRLVTAQEEERRTISRELHDEVGQALTALKVELAIVQRNADLRGESGHLLDDARAMADGALHSVRDLSHLLHPSLLDDLGLPAAIDRYLRGISQRHGLSVDLMQENMDERLQPEVEVCAYRIVQEAVTNVVKHAHATRCHVHLLRKTDLLEVTIEDDGCGFDTAAPPSPERPRGLGLLGIRERVATLRGTLRIISAPDTGTRVTVEMPARTRATEADESTEADAQATALMTPEVLRG